MSELPTSYQEFIHRSRYSRWLNKEKRRESWQETVARYFDFMESHLYETYNYTLKKSLRDELQTAVLNLEVMPSMRALMTAGPALQRDHIGAYNCAFVHIDTPRAFDEILYILMNGTGMGFSVERQFVAKLPVVAEEFYPTDTTIVVLDSKLGWAKAFKELISMLYVGQIPKWDLSKVRPAGSPLKTFGGRASGPEPLDRLFKFTVNIFRNAAGRKLQSTECHDIVCKTAEIVVVGGVRRSALISLSNLSDDRMRAAKSGQWWTTEPQRSLANNSACYTEKPDIGIFMDEWKALYESKSGERGIFNRKASKLQAAKFERRDPNWDFGTNPCCVVGETPILTSDGYYPISSLVDKKVCIWNGFEWSDVVPFRAGNSNVIRVHLSNGTYLDCTPNHKFVIKGKRIKGTSNHKQVFVEAKDLSIGDKLNKYDMPVLYTGEDYSVDAYSQGFYSGDGTKNNTRSYLYETKYCCQDRLIGEFLEPTNSAPNRKSWTHGEMFKKSFVPVNGSLNYKLNWLAGLIDSDGCKTKEKNGNGCQITSIDKNFLDNVRLMLTTLGVDAKICLMHEERMSNFGGEKEYLSKPVFRIVIGCQSVFLLKQLGLQTNRVKFDGNYTRNASRFITVTDIEDLEKYEEVFCFTEPKNHTGTFNGIVTGQSEIILRSREFCNLSEVVVRENDTPETLKEKVRLATILGTFQSTLTSFKYISKEWKKNCEEERLLGVSLTGIMDNKFMAGKVMRDLLPAALENLRNHSVEVNKKLAKELGIEQSVSITCIKPSGTVSQLVDSASGIHARHSEYYIRTVRADNKDPLCKLMIEKGFPHEPDVMNPDSVTVFSFPMKSPTFAVFRNDMTAIEQLELWLLYQRHWCEHKPSITVTVREEEWMEVGAFVYKHFDEMSGVSFLPHSDHIYQQAPYQECDQITYEEFLAKMPEAIDWAELSKYEEKDHTAGSQTYACSGNSCEVVDLT